MAVCAGMSDRDCPCAGEVQEGTGRRSRDSSHDLWSVSKGGLSRYGPAHVPRLLSECAFFPKEGQAPRGGAPCVVVHLEEA